jgi:hypothetical protein
MCVYVCVSCVCVYFVCVSMYCVCFVCVCVVCVCVCVCLDLKLLKTRKIVGSNTSAESLKVSIRNMPIQ